MCLVESLGKWAADILGRLKLQLVHTHACSQTHIYKENLSHSKCFFFFFLSSNSYLLTPAMDTAALAGIISSLLYEKKKAKESGSPAWPSELSEYLTETQPEL